MSSNVGEGDLEFFGKLEPLNGKFKFQFLIDDLYQKEWVVYCKKPFKSPWYVLRCLGRYTHRVAISNQRFVSLQDGKVTFSWRDYKDDNRTKLMTLEASEFIRRFLLHVLPSRFVKIRHYGILSNRNRNIKLRLCQRLTLSNIGPAIPNLISVIEYFLCCLMGEGGTMPFFSCILRFRAILMLVKTKICVPRSSETRIRIIEIP